MLWTGLEHQSYDMAGKIEEGVYYLYTVVVVVVGRSIILLLQIVGEGDIF